MRRTAAVLVLIICGCVLFALTTCRDGAGPPAGAPRDLFAPNLLLGKAAPSFVTVDPDGNTIDLKQHLGKNVIMLDYWATWCGPCIIAMPHIAEVAKKYEDRGLVFYAVNEGEDPDTVKEFLAQMKLDIPVAMDFDGRIQAIFKASYLPHTILIGKDGTVQAAHLGFRDDLAELLSNEIEDLLAGKDLVVEAPAE